MGLIPEEARLVRDKEAAALRSLPWQELVDRYRYRREECRRVTEGGKSLELAVAGELDYEDDPTSCLYVWLSVRPAWLAPIPGAPLGHERSQRARARRGWPSLEARRSS